MNPQLRILALYGSYTKTELALLEGDRVIVTSTHENMRASSALIPLMQQLLDAQGITLADLNYLAIDAGPGAFTSLRVAISTINGIAFASKIPLIGTDGLDALAAEVTKQVSLDCPLVCMLNAYNKEVYYAVYFTGAAGALQRQAISGYCALSTFLDVIADTIPETSFVCAGNGAQLYANEITEKFRDRATIAQVSHASAATVGIMALKAISAGECGTSRLLPQYLKTQHFVAR